MSPFDFRKELKISQKDMASMLGCSKAMVCMIESGKRQPSLTMLKKYESVSGGKVSLKDF